MSKVYSEGCSVSVCCDGDGDLLFSLSPGGIKFCRDVLIVGSGGTGGAGDGVLLDS